MYYVGMCTNLSSVHVCVCWNTCLKDTVEQSESDKWMVKV